MQHDATASHSTQGFAGSKSQPASSLLGDYEILGELGRGGMGVVYRARQVSANRLVALKVVRAGEFASAQAIARFKAEAEAAANLDHPNLTPVYDVGEVQGQHYFSMKLAEGGSLRDAQGRYRDRPLAVAELLATIAHAVHHAHQRGILHRDLKPSNILLDESGVPLVADFGLVKRLDAVDGPTQTDAILGTPAYMPPEQAGREKNLTVRADVYSLGAILYELLAGKPPFSGETVLEVLDRVRSQEPTPIRSLNPGVPRDLETICLKCLAKDPGRRYADAAALADDLERWTRGEPITARPVSRFERLWLWVKRNPLLATMSTLLALLTVTLLVGSLGAAWYFQSQSHTLTEANRTKDQAIDNMQVALDGQSKARLAEKAERERAESATDALRERLGRIHLDRAWQVPDADPSLRALWLAEALKADGENPQRAEFHRARLVAHLDAIPGPALLVPGGGEGLTSILSPDGRYVVWIASGEEAAGSRLIEVETGKVLFDGMVQRKQAGAPPTGVVQFSPDGSRLLAWDAARKEYGVYQCQTGERIGAIPVRWISAAMWSPSGAQILVSTQNEKLASEMRLFRGDDFQLVSTMPGSFEAPPRWLSPWSSTEKHFLLRSTYGAYDSQSHYQVWEAETGKRLSTWKGELSVRFTSGERIAILPFRSVPNARAQLCTPAGEVLFSADKLEFLPDGKQFLAVHQLPGAWAGLGLALNKSPLETASNMALLSRPGGLVYHNGIELLPAIRLRLHDAESGEPVGPFYSPALLTRGLEPIPESESMGPGKYRVVSPNFRGLRFLYQGQRILLGSVPPLHVQSNPGAHERFDAVEVRDTKTGLLRSTPLTPPEGCELYDLHTNPGDQRALAVFRRRPPPRDRTGKLPPSPPSEYWTQMVEGASLMPLSQPVRLPTLGRQVLWSWFYAAIVIDEGEPAYTSQDGFGQRVDHPAKPARLHYLRLPTVPMPNVLQPLELTTVELPTCLAHTAENPWKWEKPLEPKDGSFLLRTQDDRIHRYCLDFPRPVHPPLEPLSKITSMSLVRGGTHLLTNTSAGTFLRDLTRLPAAPRANTTLETSGQTRVAIWRDPQGDEAFSAAFLWSHPQPKLFCNDGRTGRQLWQHLLPVGATFESLKIDPTSRYLSGIEVVSKGVLTRRVRLWDLRTGKSLDVPNDPDPEPVLVLPRDPQPHRDAFALARPPFSQASPIKVPPETGAKRTVVNVGNKTLLVETHDNRCRVWEPSSKKFLGPEIVHWCAIREVWVCGGSGFGPAEDGGLRSPWHPTLVRGEDHQVQVYNPYTGKATGPAISPGADPVTLLKSPFNRPDRLIGPRGVWKVLPDKHAAPLTQQHTFNEPPRRVEQLQESGSLVPDLLLTFKERSQILRSGDRFEPASPHLADGSFVFTMLRGVNPRILWTSDGKTLRRWNYPALTPNGEPITPPGTVLGVFQDYILTTTHQGAFYGLSDEPLKWNAHGCGPVVAAEAVATQYGEALAQLVTEDGSRWLFHRGNYTRVEDQVRTSFFTAAGDLLIETQLGRIRCVDPTTGQIRWHALGTQVQEIPRLGRLLVTDVNRQLELRDARTGQVIARLAAGTHLWIDRIVSPDQSKLLTLSDTARDTRHARVHDLTDGKPIGTEWTTLREPFFSPEGRWVYFPEGKAPRERTRAIDLTTGALCDPPEGVRPDWNLFRLPGTKPVAGEIPPLASPDGRYLLVTGKEGVRVHDRLRGEAISPVLPTREGTPTAFTPDGRFVLVGERVYESARGLPVTPVIPFPRQLAREGIGANNPLKPYPSIYYLDTKGLLLLDTPLWRTEGARLRQWRWVVPEDNAELIRWAEQSAGRRIDATGTVLPLAGP